ncbi:MAG: DNA polymerase III subunit gamma/tau [Clostridia bacterium]|nr:DNA polymerase III subunit gamma/tau [Clostridia bacterium]
MSYQVLYRAWRPGTFSEICGQDAVTRTLRRQVVSGHIAHAYLFCGTRGTGKTTASKVLARAINCLNPKDGDPCGECEVCRALKAENCMDVVEIDAASNNGVDEIRDLREKIKYPPTLTKYKVYIIDEVHMLSTGAFNALLKTLEEPPAHAVFILATTEPQKLPATILSRCQRFDFHRISVDTMVARMKVVLSGVGRTAEDEALREIGRAAEGAMRDALSLLDGCLSYTDGEVTLQLARDVLGTAGRGFLFDFAEKLIAFDIAGALSDIDRLINQGCDPQVFARDVVAHLRALILASAVENIAEMLEITPEDAQKFAEQSRKIDSARAARLMDLYMRAESDMKWASRPRTVLELATVRACHPEEEADAALSERMARMEKMLEGGVSVKPVSVKVEKKEASPADASKPIEKKPARSFAQPPQEYLNAIESIGAETPSIRATLSSMQFVAYDSGVLAVEFSRKNMMHMKMLERKKAMLEAAFSDAFGTPVSLRMQLEGDRAQSAPVGSAAKRVIEESYDVFGRDKIDLTN